MVPAERDARFMRSLLAASDDCIKVISLDGSLAFMSEGGQRVMEVSDFNLIAGCPWPDFWVGQGNLDAVAALRAAREGRSSRFQGRANTAAGNPRFWDVQVSPILGPDGKPESILSVSRDITLLKNAEEQQALLGLELAHRMKNTLTIVQAIASQTLRDGREIGDAREAFLARIVAMGRATDLLTAGNWSNAQLADVMSSMTRNHQPERFETKGPEVELSPKCALAMALALHELATNATKYGALSRNEGQIKAVWSIDGHGDDRIFHFSWEERGGPPVVPPTKTGFGSNMIGRLLASYFEGKASIAHLPSGLVFRLEAPLAALTREGSATG